MIENVAKAVGSVKDPNLDRTLADLELVRQVNVSESGVANIEIALVSTGAAASKIAAAVQSAAEQVPGVTDVSVKVELLPQFERNAIIEKVRGKSNNFADSTTRVLAISSGKGGVGKSSVTANLAISLANKGHRVGIIDADVHGFSIPNLLDLTDDNGNILRPVQDNGMMVPPAGYGVKAISIGMFLPEEANKSVVAWRGPVLHRTLGQFLNDVKFDDLDFLLVDMPPGTGDVAMSIGQYLPNAEVIVVTTPQPAAADVAIRSGLIARQLGQRVIGVIENMGPATMPDGSVVSWFGEGGGAAVAAGLKTETEQVPVLGIVPLSMALRTGGDSSKPVVVSKPEDPSAKAIAEIADRVIALA